MTTISAREAQDMHGLKNWRYAWTKRAISLGAPLKRGEGHFLIDYTEELWRRSEGIVEGIIGLRRMIASLYSSKEGIAQLLNGGGERILLHAPEPKKGKRK